MYDKELIKKMGVEYIKAGFSIHLLHQNAKNPTLNNWSNVNNLTEIDFLNSINTIYKNNIGIRLGEKTIINGRYLYVLDLDISSDDIKDIQEAHRKIKSIYSEYLKLPSVCSASKNSRHYYFLSKINLNSKKIASSKTKVKKIINGEEKTKNSWEIDLCSTGRQVVLPPSVFNNNTYKWEKNILDYLNNEAKIADMIIDDINLLNLNIENETKETVINFENEIKKETKKDFKIDEVKKILNNLPSDFYDNYDDWLKVGMALHFHFHDTEDEQEAINLYDNFSKKSEKYERGQAFKKWNSFKYNEDGITLGTLIFNANKEINKNPFQAFSLYLNNDEVNLTTLKEKLKILHIKDYEIDMIKPLICEKLTNSLGYKVSNPVLNKILKSIFNEIKQEKEDKLNQMAIGLDDTLSEIVLKNTFEDGKYLINLNNNIFKYNLGVWQTYEKSILEYEVLNSLKKILESEEEKYSLVKETIFKTKKNDDLRTLTKTITELVLIKVASREADDILNFRNTKKNDFYYINTKNSEIYIQNQNIEIQNHSYDSYFTTQYDVYYDETADCPNWHKVLNNVFQNNENPEDVKRHFLEVLAYSIMNKKPNAIFIICIGNGSNGKSFIFSEIRKFLGIGSVVSASLPSFFQNQHATAALPGKTLFLDDDWKKNAILPDDDVKKLSEDKYITANPKFGQTFEFVSKVTPIILSNSMPKTHDNSHGLTRRAQVFNFNYQFTSNEIDITLSEKLAQERSGFLNLLLKSFINYLKRGQKFIEPIECLNQKKKWENASNPIKAFIDEKLILTKDASDKITVQIAFEKYKQFIEENDSYQNKTRNNFIEDICTIDGIKKIRDTAKNQDMLTGLKVKSFYNNIK